MQTHGITTKRPEGALSEDEILALVKKAKDEDIKVVVYTVLPDGFETTVYSRVIDDVSSLSSGRLRYSNPKGDTRSVSIRGDVETVFIFDNYFFARAYALKCGIPIRWKED